MREAFERVSKMTPAQASFDAHAARMWDKFYCDWDGKERPGLYGAATKRIHVFVRKLAMTYAALEKTAPTITADQLKAAIGVGLYAAECARTLIELKNAALRPEGEIEQRMIEWIKKNDGARKRFMQQCLTRICGSCDVFNRTVTNLFRADLIELREGRVYIRN